METLSVKSYQGRAIEMDAEVAVYRNLKNRSLTIKVGSLVHGYTQLVELSHATFSVSKKGNQRVRRLKQRDVHAYVKGRVQVAKELQDVEAVYATLEDAGYTRIYYNPYKVDAFVVFETQEPVFSADRAIVVLDRVYVETYQGLASSNA